MQFLILVICEVVKLEMLWLQIAMETVSLAQFKLFQTTALPNFSFDHHMARPLSRLSIYCKFDKSGSQNTLRDCYEIFRRFFTKSSQFWCLVITQCIFGCRNIYCLMRTQGSQILRFYVRLAFKVKFRSMCKLHYVGSDSTLDCDKQHLDSHSRQCWTSPEIYTLGSVTFEKNSKF